jgi:hypothetical protein
MNDRDSPAELNELSRRILRAIERYSALAWPLLKTQCRLTTKDPATLEESDLPVVAAAVGTAAARFTSPDKGERLRREILALGTAEPVDSPSSTTLFSPSAPLGRLSARIAEVLAAHTLGWTLFENQCARGGIDPVQISGPELESILPDLERALARFSSPMRAVPIVTELRSLRRQTA